MGSRRESAEERRAARSTNAFVVVQDLFMTETAQRADIVLPAASAYEKNGTVTNVCGEVQKLKQAVKVMGTKTDLEIIGLIAKEMGLNLGIWLPDKVFEEIRKTVHGYNVPLPVARHGRRGADHATERPRGRAARRRFSPPATRCSLPVRSRRTPRFSTP